MKHLLVLAVGLGMLSGVAARGPSHGSLQALFEGHRWFELRDAIGGQTAPALYVGAVASAFNQTSEAERHLRRAVREAADAERANDAREALANLYMRLGRSADLVRIIDDALAAAPGRADLRNALKSFESFRRAPDQTARAGRRRPFQCTVRDDGVRLPLVVNGKSVEWLFDTAFSHSAVSESEARLLGIGLQGGTGAAEDFAGGSTPFRTAVAARVAVGDAELRNVPVLVFPDSQPPWSDEAPGKRGTVALPVVLALEGIRWTRDGTCQTGPSVPRARSADANLAFDGASPLTRVQMSGHHLDFVLDTGNQSGTQLGKVRSRFSRSGQYWPQGHEATPPDRRLHRTRDRCDTGDYPARRWIRSCPPTCKHLFEAGWQRPSTWTSWNGRAESGVRSRT
jgi:hypothetical protein